MQIYHLVPKLEWEREKTSEFFVPLSLAKVGFIHCSTKDQILATANRKYSGVADLLLLVIDTTKIPVKIIYELSKGSGEKHPHIYGKLPIAAIQVVLPVKPDANGKFTNLPVEL